MHIQRENNEFKIYGLPFNDAWSVPYDSKLGKKINNLLGGECSLTDLETLITNTYCAGLTPTQIIKGAQRIRIQAFTEGIAIGKQQSL